MRVRQLVLLALLVFVNTGGICGGFTPPKPDSCSMPATRTLDSLVVGSLGDSEDESKFVPLSDGDHVHLVFGPQGGTMLPIRLRVAGSDAVGCLPQVSTLASVNKDQVPIVPVAGSAAPLRTYAEPDGSATTHPLYLIFENDPVDNMILLTVEAGGLQVKRMLNTH